MRLQIGDRFVKLDGDIEIEITGYTIMGMYQVAVKINGHKRSHTTLLSEAAIERYYIKLEEKRHIAS